MIKWGFEAIKEEYLTNLYWYLIMLSIIVLQPVLMLNLNENKLYYEDNGLDKMSLYIKNNTEKDIVLFTSFENTSITRKMERGLFVMYKFIPAEMNKIHEWYKRVLETNKVYSDLNHLQTLSKEYKIDYYLSENPCSKEFLELEQSIDHYYLYKIKRGKSK